MTRTNTTQDLLSCISHKACDNLENFKNQLYFFEKGVTAVTDTSQLINL